MKPSPINTTISSALIGRMPSSTRLRARGYALTNALPRVLLVSSASAAGAAIWRRRQGGLHHAG
ncbi:MAG TPA: hypothetical protein VNA65_09660 [Candidatus Dormibacteraeota bacterium]|nr:hypothetical protein [Candidatus Dormibacteraeota bacterium]